jgi:hypothetical protein
VLQTAEVDAIFEATESRLARYRAKAAEEEKAKAAALAVLQEKQRREEEEAEKHRLAAIEQYKMEAERLVRQEEEAMRREAEERKKREEAEAAEAARKEAASSPADDAERRASIMHRRNSAAVKRQEMSKHLTLSKRAEAKLEPKVKSNAAELFGVEAKAPEEEWGEGKSKIWKALNPKPLYYVTAKERREREENTVELGVIGTARNFNTLRDVLSPELNSPDLADKDDASNGDGVKDKCARLHCLFLCKAC